MRITIPLFTLLSLALFCDATFLMPAAAHAQTGGLFGNATRGTIGGSGGSTTGGDVGGVTPGDRSGGRISDGSLINGASRESSFVGSDNADRQRFIGSSQADSQANLQQIMRGLNQGFQSNQPQNQNRGSAQRKFRTRVRIGFRPVPISNTQIGERLSRSLQTHFTAEMNVVINARTAILRGSVATHHARRLAEQMALLEPGISRVQNEIVVILTPDDQP